MVKAFIFDMGEIVKDSISGFIGIIVARTQYLTGCNTYCIQPKGLDKEKRPQEVKWFDEVSLISTGNEFVPPIERTERIATKGGPCNPTASSRAHL